MFERTFEGSRALVALNASENAVMLEISGVYTDALNNARVDGTLTLQPRSGVILEGI